LKLILKLREQIPFKKVVVNALTKARSTQSE